MNYRNNLQRLATYLAYGERPKGTRFQMKYFSDQPYSPGHKETDCGTAGCAVGHAPFIEGFQKYASESWTQYSTRLFGMSPHTHAWNWCFGGSWHHSDNTALGAAQRIQYLIDHGRPPNGFHWMLTDQWDAFIPLYAEIQVAGAPEQIVDEVTIKIDPAKQPEPIGAAR